MLSKLFSLLGKGAGGVASLLMGRGMLKKAGALAFGALGAKKLVGMLRGGGKKTLAMKAEIWLPGQQVNLD
ncbi:putative structural injection transglycosylase [Escherichia coli]|uniref:Putative structural injection transglycosylase n=1 Tax=Escherichia coli TaxID=562 RepID=A0A377AZB3_ECOLX|nr:putative structural injection transglycosylase [Escherichia coli]